MFSEAIEDYLKAIYQLQEGGDRAGTSDLARLLAVAPASVTGMLKRLAELGLAAHEPYRGAALTDEGRRRALQVIRNHRLAELFLSEILGLPLDQVHAEAHKWEHFLSEQVAQRIDTALDHPLVDPHGSPIPTRDGRIERPDRRPLAELEPGQSARVAEVADHDPELLRYLVELELIPGARVIIVARQPLAGPVTIRVADREHTVGPEVTRHVHVDSIADPQPEGDTGEG